MLNVEIKSVPPVLVVAAAILLVLGATGWDPRGGPGTLPEHLRIGFAVIGGLITVGLLVYWYAKSRPVSDPGSVVSSGMTGRHKPFQDWPAGEIEYVIEVSNGHRERTLVLNDLLSQKMRDCGFAPEIIRAYLGAFGEATANAFGHGCKAATDQVQLRFEVTTLYASFTVLNPVGRPFDLVRATKRATKALKANPVSRRGRGLLEMQRLCDQLSPVTDGQSGVKAVFARESVEYVVSRVEDVAIACLKSGIQSPSFERRTAKLVAKYQECHVLLDFSDWITGGTVVYTVVVDAKQVLAGAKRKVVALLFEDNSDEPDQFSPVKMLEELVAYDVPTALEKLDRKHLVNEIAAIVEREKRPHHAAAYRSILDEVTPRANAIEPD